MEPITESNETTPEPLTETKNISRFQAKLRLRFFGHEILAAAMVELMNGFAQGRFGASHVYEKAQGLLVAHEDLTLELQQIMSKALEDDAALDAFEVFQISEKAKAFAQKVHQKFMEYESIPQNFEEIMEQIADNRLQWDQAFEKIKHLFCDHQSLTEDICATLNLPDDYPKDYEVEKNHINFFEKVKAEFADNEEVYLEFLKVMTDPELESHGAVAKVSVLFMEKAALFQEFMELMGLK